ncbi:MAG: hypothetical protein ACI9L9_001401, partial [Marivirga sp.]
HANTAKMLSLIMKAVFMTSSFNKLFGRFFGFLFTAVLLSSCLSESEGDFTGEGRGGSMARFTFLKGYLYIVDNSSLKTIDIMQPENPQVISTIQLNAGIETIFPYENYLFLGSQFGMYIYSLEDGPVPTFLSLFEHSYSCDPVVVANGVAYVTLRSGTSCNAGPNRMEVVDVTDFTNPQLIQTIPMVNPHGLTISDTLLFVGEGDFGLKVFNIKDRRDPVLMSYDETIPTYDVINNYSRKELIITGSSGVYQYSYQNPDSLFQLSQIISNKNQ